MSNKANEAAKVVINDNGATVGEVLRSMLKLSPEAVKRVRKKSPGKRKKPKA